MPRNPRFPLATLAPLVGLLALFLVVGCGGNGDGDTTSSSGAPEAASSRLAAGPPAFETLTPNPGMAEWGEQLFREKACVTCHAIGEKKQGPDLAGVTRRRTEAWMKRMMMDPEWMVANDPTARELMATYMIKMANQQVQEPQANALIQYLLSRDLESGN